MLEPINPKIFILIPAYNEEAVIGSVILRLKEAGYGNILVVNDGSKDNTARIAESAGAEVLNHIMNRGQGSALETGIKYLRETHRPDIIITFDADGQHSVEDIARLIRPIIEENFDIVLGSRFLNKKARIPLLRKAILKAGILFTSIISRIELSDTHNGIRALGKRAINSIEIYHRGMEHASDIIDEIARNGLKYKEVPVTITYSEYSLKKGQKNLGFIKMGLKILLNKIIK